MQPADNPPIALAYDFVRTTRQNIFLTGKAGTGKTTFLHQLKKEGLKRMVVVAPTGVAAINAGGMTIHSFFQLPFGLWLPDAPRTEQSNRKFSSDKIRTIKSLELLVIDEISMVRADLLDAIDEVLRRYKNPYEPFGGVQLLMIGDLHQLPPVVKNEEWELLRKHYTTPYFFGSLALKQTNPVTIELKHIYRQSDAQFIALLNRVRDNQLDEATLAQLNSRYLPQFVPPPHQHYITLTSHNQTAANINVEHLNRLTGKSQTFKAEIDGDFPPYSFPTDEVLELKLDAQVMFVKNDTSPDKLYYNGKIGKVIKIESHAITVQCPYDAEAIQVYPALWENIKYTLNETTKEVDEHCMGTFKQYPLKLAWAITIHKSQGLTFERAIIDAQDAFAHGQVYVALSRCKSFEGIVLRSRIQNTSVKTDTVVRNYSEESEKNAPNQQHLLAAKAAYQEWLLEGVFSFRELKSDVSKLVRTFAEHQNTLGGTRYQHLKQVQAQVQDKVWGMADKFVPQLQGYFAEGVLPEENEALQERLKKAAHYFIEQLQAADAELKQFVIETDNKAVRKTAQQQFIALKKSVFIKLRSFELLQQGFQAEQYLRSITNAELDFVATQTISTTSTQKAPRDVPHPELYSQLTDWRTETAETNDVEAYEVLSNKSLRQIVEYLPTDTKHLSQIVGIGPVKLKQFGAELTHFIEQYCTKYQLKTNLLETPDRVAKPAKPDTKQISLDAFKAGKTVEEVARERALTPGTVFGHLVHFVATGQVEVGDLVTAEKQALIEPLLLKHTGAPSSEIKSKLPESVTYDEIKAVMHHLKWQALQG